MIDIREPLYDSSGFQHFLVSASQSQIVTRTRGSFGVWNRETGECLIQNNHDLRLSNSPPDTSRLPPAPRAWPDVHSAQRARS
jgi:hypothetical protein